MATTVNVKFLPRRDTAASINAVTLAANEIAICTDTHEIRWGDGTLGGVQIGFENPMTQIGDLMVGGAAGVPTRLTIGVSNAALVVNTAGTGFTFTTNFGGTGSTITKAVTVKTDTGNQDDYDVASAGILWANNATVLTLRGITGGSAGRELLIAPKGAGPVYLMNASTHSATVNRLDTRFVSTANALIIGAKGSARLLYDDIAQRWVVVDWSSGVPTGAQNYTSLTRAADQTTTSGAAAYISFDTEVSNAYGVFSTGAPTRLTVPPGQGGLWMFNCHFWFNASITGIVQFGMRKNGTDFMFSADIKAEGTCQYVLTSATSLAENDYVEFYAYQASGGDRTVRVQAFSAFRLQ